MRLFLENEYLKAQIETVGAQLFSLIRREDGCEMMWEADPRYWGEASPLLFPFVGKCKNLQYRYQGRTYSMVQHGFGKRMEFEVVTQERDRLVLAITDTPETREQYPFAFYLEAEYVLTDSALTVEWRVHNKGQEDMYFSIGGHPGFACPPWYEKAAERRRTLCSLRLYGTEEKREITNLCVGEDGLLSGETIPLSPVNGILPVTEHLFDQDALLLRQEEVKAVGILDSRGREFVRVESRTPVWGIWSLVDNAAPYICIEPWFGLCDDTGYQGTLEERPLSNCAPVGGCWKGGYRIIVD